MKRAALIMALVVGMAFVAAHAAPTARQKAQARHKTQAGQTAGRQAKVLGCMKRLELSDQQRADAKRMFEQARERVKAVRKDTKLTDAQKIAEVKEIHKTAMTELRSILTPDQQKKLDAAIERMKNQRRDVRSKLERIGKGLDLTAEQKDHIKQIFAAHKDELKALKGNRQLSREQNIAEFKKLREAMRAEIRSILTPEQQKKFDRTDSRFEKRIRERMKERRASVK